MSCDVEMQDLAAPMLDDEQTIQQLERDRRDGEEIERDDDFAMVLKERQPTLPRVIVAMHTSDIPRDAPFRDLEAELQQFAVDLRRSPTGILLRQPMDQVADFTADLRSAR